MKKKKIKKRLKTAQRSIKYLQMRLAELKEQAKRANALLDTANSLRKDEERENEDLRGQLAMARASIETLTASANKHATRFPGFTPCAVAMPQELDTAHVLVASRDQESANRVTVAELRTMHKRDPGTYGWMLLTGLKEF